MTLSSESYSEVSLNVAEGLVSSSSSSKCDQTSLVRFVV